MRLAWRVAAGVGLAISLAGAWTPVKTLRRVQLGNDLLAAAERGDPAQVRTLLRSGADPEARSEYSATSLHHAEAADDPESVMLLVEHGANVNARDRSGRTAMQRSAIRGDVQMVLTFLELGVDVENADITGRTAMVSAAAGGHPEVVEVLLKAGASTQPFDRKGMTALHMAAANRHEKVVEVLLKHGANPRPPSHHGLTPAIVALRRHSGASPFNRFLPSGVEIPDTTFGRDGRPGLSRILRLLARYGADLESRGPGGHSVLQLCVGQVDGATIDELRRHGARDSPTADLILAIWLARTGEARAALERGAAVDGQTVWGESALWMAACLRRPEIAELLLRRHANPNLGHGGGSTPLVIAAGRGDEAMVSLLLRYGALVNITRPSPIERLHSPLLAAITRRHARVARRLLEAGADVNQSDWSGFTPLMTAAAQGDVEIVGLLLEAGAIVNFSTEAGTTALSRACLAERFEVVELLLRHGADPTVRNDQDRSLIQQLDIYQSTRSPRSRQRARIATLLRRAMEKWEAPESLATHRRAG